MTLTALITIIVGAFAKAILEGATSAITNYIDSPSAVELPPFKTPLPEHHIALDLSKWSKL